MPDLLLKIMEKVSVIKGMAAIELENRLWQNWRDYMGEIGTLP
jgi:hypothetical protein